MRFKKLKRLVEKWDGCDLCRFAEHRRKMVWGKGRLDSGIVLIGEAPGREEDVYGQPFVGKAGEILDTALTKSSLSYKPGSSNCLIINALSCRPCNEENGPNRTPRGLEIESCQPRLQATLRIARPSLVILLGNTAARAVFGFEHIPHEIEIGGVKFLKTLHPMATVYDKARVESWNLFWRKLKTVVRKFEYTRPSLKWKLPL